MNNTDKNKEEKKEIIECPICISRLLPSKSVMCLYCNYKTCRPCAQRVLTDSPNDPQCMNCRKVWNNEFIHSTFPKSFYSKDLKNHRENVLFEREKSLLPSTQPILERIRTYDKEKKDIDQELREINQMLHELKLRKRELTLRKRTLSYRDPMTDIDSKNENKEKTFVRQCPAPDCRGFLSTSWKCGLCDTLVCSKCHEIKNNDINHVCKPENIESAKLIDKDTKPCPKCSARIFKISGCDQMWCCNCKTPFSWKTGQIINHGIIHNPHYFEWRRNQNQNERTLGDLPCGGVDILLISDISEYLIRDGTIDVGEWTRIEMSRNQIIDLLRTYPTEHTIRDNIGLRLDYLSKEIDDSKFKQLLQRNEKKNSRLIEEGQILRMCSTVMGEELTALTLDITLSKYSIPRTVKNNSKKLNDKESALVTKIMETYSRLLELRNYTNQQLIKLSSRYSNICKSISDSWYMSDTNRGKVKKSRKPTVINDMESDNSDTDDNE